jgi:pimeloyl-ACP methyl ester carboxylesterase
MIYGESGGAMLAHQYLAEYGQHVAKAFTRACLHPYLAADLGLNSDRFWKEIGEYDPKLYALVNMALDRYKDQRQVVVMTLQRQNFFVVPDELGAARAELIQALADGDEEYFSEVREKYEVDAVNEIMRTNDVIPIRVRLFEFLIPSDARERLKENVLYPDYEVQVNLSKPLLELYDTGKIPPIYFDFTGLHSLSGEVFILAGRWDHVVDYRTSIALAANYPGGFLFLADDDHMFKGFEDSGLLAPMLQSFFLEGMESEIFTQSVKNAEPHRWKES